MYLNVFYPSGSTKVSVANLSSRSKIVQCIGDISSDDQEKEASFCFSVEILENYLWYSNLFYYFSLLKHCENVIRD